MYIFIMRHGEAENISQNDQDRQLTNLGCQQSRQTAKWLQKFVSQHQCNLDLALVSPYIRAQQTYQQVTTQVTVEHAKNCIDIIPAGNPRLAHDYIEALITEQPEMQAMLVVSHLPLVSYLLDELCNQSYALLFSTGAIAALHYDVDHSRAQLLEQFTPD